MRPQICIVAVCFSIGCIAQPNLVNRSLTDSSLNYFYIGVENEIEANWKGVNPDRIWVTIDGGGEGSSITKIDKNRYVVRVTSVTDSCLVQVHLHGNVMILNSYYKCRYLNNAIASLANIEDSITTVNKILINPLIVVFSPGSHYRVDFNLREFSLDIIHEGDTTSTRAFGNWLSNEQKKLVKNLVPGDQLYFHQIIGFFPGGRAVKLPPFRLYLR